MFDASHQGCWDGRDGLGQGPRGTRGRVSGVWGNDILWEQSGEQKVGGPGRP